MDWYARIVLRHWRGQLPLAVAYWVIGFALSLAVILFGHFIGRLDLPPSAGATVFIGFITFVLLLTIWQLVGIWRSAGMSISQGRKFWPWAARLAVILGALQTANAMTRTIGPMLQEHAKIVIGKDDTPPHRIRILRNGTELELGGGMPFGTADTLAKVLDAAPMVKIIHLNSDGGRIVEGHAVYRLIRARQLVTYTSTDCVSACTIAFIAGTRRYLALTARLGFHSQSIGSVDSKALPEINNDMKATLRSHGVPEWFLTRALSTAANDMWYPTHAELKSANIVTDIVDPNKFAISGIDINGTAPLLDQALLTIRVYVILKEHDRVAYDQLRDALLNGMRSGQSTLELQGQAQALLVTILPKYLKVAPSAPLVAYWRTQAQYLSYLQSAPNLCVQFLFPEKRAAAYDVSKYVPQSVVQQNIEALADVVTSAVAQPVRETIEAETILQEVVQSIQRLNPQAIDILAEPTKFISRPEVVCKAFSTYLNEVLRLPVAKAGIVLRSFWQANPPVSAPTTSSIPAPFLVPTPAPPPAGTMMTPTNALDDPARLPRTEQIILPPPRPPATREEMFERAFGGVWAMELGACPGSGEKSNVPQVTITAARAQTPAGTCEFTEKRGSDEDWNVKAECSDGMKRQTLNVNLTRQGDILKWTSKNGTFEYHRC